MDGMRDEGTTAPSTADTDDTVAGNSAPGAANTSALPVTANGSVADNTTGNTPDKTQEETTEAPSSAPQTSQTNQTSDAAAPAAPKPESPPEQPQPQNAYSVFREQLKHVSARPVISQIQDFVTKFPTGLARNEAARRVHKFLTAMQDWMLSESVVFAAEADEEGRTSTAEGLEKFLLSRLHPKIFATDPQDSAEDARLQKHIDGLKWVEFKHLGMPPVDPALLTLAMTELCRIDNYKAPRDKLVCIMNSCRVINDVLRQVRSECGMARPLSADDFLPLLIYAVILANPPRLHSNVEFVAGFRHPSRLVAEEAYFLTTLQSAVAFIKDASPKVLDISPEEFDKKYAAALAEKAVAENGEEATTSSTTGTVDPTTVAAKATDLSPAARKRLRIQLESLQCRFEAVQSVRQLRVDDLPNLLEEYRTMARLLRNIGTATFEC